MKKFYLNSERNAGLLSKQLKYIRLLLVVFCFIPLMSFGQTNSWSSVLSSDWNDPTNWSLGHVPLATEDVLIPHTLLSAQPVISVAGAVCKTLTINNALLFSNTLTINAPGTLVVTGAVTINNVYNVLSILAGDTTIAVNAGTLTAGSVVMNDSGNNGRRSVLSITTGTVNVLGNITMTATDVTNLVSFSGSGILNIGGTMTGGAFTKSTSTVNYNNLGNQIVGDYSYYNLTSSGSGIKTLAANGTISAVLSVNANTTLALGSFTLGSPTNVLLECGATTGSIISGTGLLTFGGVTVTDALGAGTSGATISCPSKISGSATFTIADDGSTATDLTISGVLDGITTSMITKIGAGTILSSANNSYTGPTTITAGVFQLGSSTVFSNTSTAIITMAGGILSTGATTGYSENAGNLNLSADSTIALGTASHSLSFTASNAVSWTSGKTLTITGWTGLYDGTTGTAGKIFVGTTNTGLTAAQLAQIRFYNASTGASYLAKILSTGEVVPLATITTNAIVGSPFCAGASGVAVGFTYALASSFPSGMVIFTAQLSDSTGSFTSPTNLQSLASDASGSQIITATIPLATAAGTGYRIRVISNSPVINGTDNGTNLIVNGRPTSVVSGTSATCSGTAKTISIALTGTSPWSLTYTDGTTSVPVGSVVSSPYVFNVSPTSTKTYTVTALSDSKCNAIAADMTGNAIITVNALPLSPVLGKITQPNCMIATGSVVLSNLPTSGTWTLKQNGTPIADTSAGTGICTVSGLTVAGSPYVFTVDNGTCPSLPTIGVIINASITKTWTVPTFGSGAWSPTPSAPTSNDAVIIDGDYDTYSDGDLNACNLTINPGVTMTIGLGGYMVVQNNLSNTGATLNIWDTGSLVMVNDSGTVSGSVNVSRTTTPYKKNDYVYWSSPVENATIATTFANWRLDYAFEYGTNWIYNIGTMIAPKGYIVMVPNPTVAPETTTVTFTGKLNNGLQKISGVSAATDYLVGNPYPSALYADQFILANAGVIDGTLSFWTHNTAIQLASGIASGTAGSGAYAYTSDDYAYYNLTGGVGTSANSDKSAFPVVPSGKIGTGQGFFVKTKTSLSGTDIVFNNAMRLDQAGTALNNSQFFKTKAPEVQKTTAIEKNRVWLDLSNGQGAFKQALLGYVSGATNAIDDLYDGETLDGNDYVDFYSVNQGKNLVIQGRSLPFDDKDVVSLGYKSRIQGRFAISIEQVDGFFTNQSVFLVDNETGAVVDLKKSSYSFTTAIGTFNDRFALKYVDKTLGTTDFKEQTDQVLISVKNKQIEIDSVIATIEKVTIFDTLGKKVFEQNHVNNTKFMVTDFVSSHQILIVKTTLQNGKIVTDKVVF